MKRAHKVLAVPRIDARLAAHGTVHLRQKRGGHLHKAHTAAQHSRGKARQIANHAAAKRHDQITAFDLFIQQPFNGLRQPRPVLRPLARIQRQCRAGYIAQGALNPVQMQRCHARFRQDGHAVTL